MNPLPKGWGWLWLVVGVVSVSGGAIDAIRNGLAARDYVAVLGGLTTILSNVTHSLNGTGGK